MLFRLFVECSNLSESLSAIIISLSSVCVGPAERVCWSPGGSGGGRRRGRGRGRGRGRE